MTASAALRVEAPTCVTESPRPTTGQLKTEGRPARWVATIAAPGGSEKFGVLSVFVAQVVTAEGVSDGCDSIVGPLHRLRDTGGLT